MPDDDRFLELAAAIVKLAVEDYRSLKNKNIEVDGDRHVGVYSRSEIEKFFQGEFCASILHDGLKSDLIGMDFLLAAT